MSIEVKIDDLGIIVVDRGNNIVVRQSDAEITFGTGAIAQQVINAIMTVNFGIKQTETTDRIARQQQTAFPPCPNQ